jgi:RNA polymerase sigma-70 factor (ECF subfamily)
MMMMRHEDVQARAHEEIAAEARLVSADPELEAIKERYREPFQKAFQAALASLEPRDKAVYRMHLVEGLTLQRIGKAYNVHHTTVLRWLEAAHQRVLDEMKRELRASLDIPAEEFESLVNILVSQLNMSISRDLVRGTDRSE